MNYFPKKLLGHEIFRSVVSRATNFFFFFEKFVKNSGPSPTDLMYTPYAWFSENADVSLERSFERGLLLFRLILWLIGTPTY